LLINGLVLFAEAAIAATLLVAALPGGLAFDVFLA
jgi:hypothetical protein